MKTSSNEDGIFFLLMVSLTNIGKVLVFFVMSGDDCITVCRQGMIMVSALGDGKCLLKYVEIRRR